MSQRFLILGFGRLAKTFYDLMKDEIDFEFLASSRSKRNLKEINDNFDKIHTFTFDLIKDNQSEYLTSLISESNFCLISINPIKDFPEQEILDAYKNLISKFSLNCKIIFISSTGKYFLREKIEEIVLEHQQSVVIRPSGLVGVHRHPGFYLSGKKNVLDPLRPINLIHEIDVAGIIKQILFSKNSISRVVSLACYDHPRKIDYYQKFCQLNHLPAPEFSKDTTPTLNYQIIDMTESLSSLNYQLVFPSVYDFIDFKENV